MKQSLRLPFAILLILICASCTQLGYYAQAVQGQVGLLMDARPIDSMLGDPAVAEKLKLKLATVKEIRSFASRELGLPDNDSYKSYTQLSRPFVLWNVVATPELSLKLEHWCFPVAGCVNYRGYYSKEDAEAFADNLRQQHFDVQVGGVTAYSTLGWFNDPVLSSFIHFPDAEMARLIFHELAHQLVYVKDDSQFNESFATAVEEAGVERWLAAHGDDKMRAKYVEFEGRKRDFLALLLKHRTLLKAVYASDATDAQKRKEKAAIFQALTTEYQALKIQWGGYTGYDRWFAEPLSNAHLAAVATYHDLVPGFRALLAGKNLEKFYAAARELAELDKKERHRRLGGTSPVDVAGE
ncbi:aminopeptidase [soil metagenome]